MNLSSEVSEIKGVGPKTAATLLKNGLGTIRDLLYYFPRDYEDYHAVTKIQDLKPGKVMIKGKIKNLKVQYTKRRNFNIVNGEIYDNTGSVRVVWYNQPYRTKAYSEDKEYYFVGNFDFKFNRYQLTGPTSSPANEIESLSSTSSGLQPIYPAKGALNSLWFKKLFDKLREATASVDDMLPITKSAPSFVSKDARRDALFNIHFPADMNDVRSAREYLAYEELFELILAAKLNKNETLKLKSKPLKFDVENTKELLNKLPFKLTNAQRVATWEILQDLEKETPMNRLLQGDVGSGKTIVAAIAAYQAFKNNSQTAILAPTAILATQHYEGLKEILEPLGVKLALLTSATKKKDDIKKQIQDGKIDIIIGTHAILTDDTNFHSLALCIIDEQHRFGVMQRQKLLEKTAKNSELKNEKSNIESKKEDFEQKPLAPHFLAMTATPIPRSLQLTIFGDLDVSIINELPKGRQPIETKIINDINMKDDLYPKIREHIEGGEQVYWICRLIEETGRSEAADVKKQTEQLKKKFPKANVDYLHGKMKPAEKDEIMQKFADGKIDILVSTTVVEVGVNVPNATQIVIMDAENYGLAQLHQLRGRVGRGSKSSSCYLIKTGEEKPSERLRELEKSTDGFHLAEVDLKLRGPGEIYGTFQHGTLDLRIATLADTRLIHMAQKHATEFTKHPEDLDNYKELAKSIHKYQQITTLN